MIDFWENYYARRDALAGANELTKAGVFDALAAAGITQVTVNFDGEGDSGQIELILAYSGDIATAIPRSSTTIHEVAWNSTECRPKQASLPEAIESLCYAYLRGPALADGDASTVSEGDGRGVGSFPVSVSRHA